MQKFNLKRRTDAPFLAVRLFNQYKKLTIFSELLVHRTGCFNGSLRRSKTSDRYTERRAGNVGEANVVAELDGSRVAAVLAADTKLDVRAGGLTELASHLNELAYANLVELCERIVLVDLLIIVSAE